MLQIGTLGNTASQSTLPYAKPQSFLEIHVALRYHIAAGNPQVNSDFGTQRGKVIALQKSNVHGHLANPCKEATVLTTKT